MVKLTRGETFQARFKGDANAKIILYFAGTERHQAEAIQSGSEFSINLDTASWKPGEYIWEAWATLDEVKTLIAKKALTLEESAIDKIEGSDVRTDAKKAVRYLREMLSGGPTLEAKKYKINNRELERHSIQELMQLLSFWEKRLAFEERKEKGLNVLGPRIEFLI